MVISPQPTKATRRIDGTNIRPDRLKRSQSSTLGFNLFDDILPDAAAQVLRRAIEPQLLLTDEIARHVGDLLGQPLFYPLRLFQRRDCLIHFVPLWAQAGAKSLRRPELAPRVDLRLNQLSHQDLPIRQRFLDDEGVAAVVGEGIGEGEGFERALLEVKVADGADGGTEFTEGEREAWVRLLRTELGNGEAEG